MEQGMPGQHMARETAEAGTVFCTTAQQKVASMLDGCRAVYTIARGSSDAAANILSYEMMRWCPVPVTSLPPSVFSLGAGVAMNDALALVVSQSGASDDLVRSAKGAKAKGAKVVALTNQPRSPVEAEAHLTIPIGAGEERAVPATKTVVGAIAAGMALLAGASPDYAAQTAKSVAAIKALDPIAHPKAKALTAALLRARHVYVIGRDTGYGAAHEVALKLKECCALHAEAYSSSEVLHGPLQLATNPLFVLILDTGAPHIQDSLDQAEARFSAAGCDVMRVRLSDVGAGPMADAAAAALLLMLMYPVILDASLALGLDPDAPSTLAKVTQTV